jgi:hypothetical protein
MMSWFMLPSFLFAAPRRGDGFVDQRLQGLGRHVGEFAADSG